MKISKSIILGIFGLILLILLPFWLREHSAINDAMDNVPTDELIIISPHPTELRQEITQAFERYYYNKHHRRIQIEYRNVGGTADIVRYIQDKYLTAFRNYYKAKYPQKIWSEEIASNFANHRLNNPQTMSQMSQEVQDARKEFLQSEVGIGIDLFFGGGMFDHLRQANQGFGVDAKVSSRHPEWFKSDIIDSQYAGEILYDRQGRTYGVCLSSFGICYNPDRISELKDSRPPENWRDLGDSRFFNNIAIADPTKSGSINKCYEMIIQQEMSQANLKYGTPDQGWQDALNLIKRIVGNARTINDSAGKATLEVSSGNAAVGMSIDFYAFAEAQWSKNRNQGKSKIIYVMPQGGSAITADPIQLLRGAPHPQAAEEFIDFLLSMEGQKIWELLPGTPGGPAKHAISRPPIRQDFYDDEKLKPYRTNPNYNPYLDGRGFEYHTEWTGSLFNLIRVLIKCIALDTQEELQAACAAINAAGGADKVPQASAKFNELPFPFSEANMWAAKLYPDGKNWTQQDVASLRRQWTVTARNNYIEAARLAQEGK